MVLKLSKIVSVSQFFTDVNKKSKAVVAIYVYASESSRLTVLENDSIPQYLVNCCSDSYKTYYFLKEYDEVLQMDINKLL